MFDKRRLEKGTYILAGRLTGAVASLRKSHQLALLMQYAWRFFASAFLARGAVLGGYAPFGVSFAAACCVRGSGFVEVLGAFFGYIVLKSGIEGLKYSAAALITVTCAHVFADFKVRQKRWFMPIVAAASISVTGFVFLTGSGSSIAKILLFFCEIAITFGATYFYILAMADKNDETNLLKLGGTMVFVATALISVYDLLLLEILSPSRIIALLIIMAVSYMGGFSPGAAMGVAMGITMDAAGGRSTFFTCAYGFSALIAGVFNRSGKTVFVCAYVIANATASLLGIMDPLYLPGLYESFIASVLFLLIPDGFWLWAKEYFISETPKTADYVDKVRLTAKHYATEAAQAFYEMYLALMQGIEHGKLQNDEDIAAIFDRAADKVCRNCTLCNVCWERDYISTLNALNDVSIPMMTCGQAHVEDFPKHFSSRCVKFPDFLIAVNESLATLFQRRQYKERIQENKGLIAQQYAGITGILRQIGGYMAEGPEFMPAKEAQLKKYAEAFGSVSSVAAYKDSYGRLRLELAGDGVAAILRQKEGFTAGLNALMGVNLSCPEQICDQLGSRIFMRELEPYCAVVGVGMRKKQGQSLSGDSGTYFISNDGKAFMLLSDGMGTGTEAAFESTTAVKLIERFLRAGIDPLETLKTIGPALKIRSSGTSFVTIDIGMVNLFTGEAQTVKCGSAPSYLRSAGSDGKINIRRIQSNTLPAGLAYENSGQDVNRMRMRDGDLLILVSDGVTDGSGIGQEADDFWLMQLIGDNLTLSPKELAAKIILTAAEKGKDDDMTALVLKLKKR